MTKAAEIRGARVACEGRRMWLHVATVWRDVVTEEPGWRLGREQISLLLSRVDVGVDVCSERS